MQMEIKKILFLPRALGDLVSVLLNVKGPISKRWMICRFLFHLKWMKWSGAKEEAVGCYLGKDIFYLPAADESQFLLKEIWKEEVYKPFLPFSKAPKVLDLGSNVGMALRYFRFHFGLQEGSVAVEADAVNMKWLRKNFTGSHVDLKNAVVSDFTGIGKVMLTTAGFLNRRFELQEIGEELEFISIMDLMKENFDLVKMDIEGGEWKVIPWLLRHPEYLLQSSYWMIEFHEEELHQGPLKDLERFFKDNGFKKKSIHSVRHYFREEAFGSHK